ncbi:NAD-dependent epimerase/dehydratase family protein [Ruegeria sp. 6PALISEP08]|uniref:NAD-dependent epimerase/dehydratase family protein n=1 Tax=Ruegeria sp. 6PALISEP08 TaxID=1225660 RepID=UPI00067EAE85|nr:NAD-dependent epimerase/dehydratase family protein [Ruegeria sp. 6PALISEP08]
MSAPRVLITGRYGFTGHYAAKELERAGWDVWGTGTHPAPEPDPNYLEADLTDARSLEQVITNVAPDAVLHLAGVAFVAHGTAESFYQVNLMGTRCLLEVLANTGHGSKAVVLASSANIYGNATESSIPETARPAPVNDYAVSKLAMEHMARLFDDCLPIVIARPFNYTGHGQDPKFLVPKIVSHFSQKLPQLELGNLDVARDFSDVRDVARIYRLLLENAPRGETVNICSGKATALGEILNMCRTITGHEIEVVSNPSFARAQEIKILMGDPSHLESLIPVGVRHSLEETLRWMLNE